MTLSPVPVESFGGLNLLDDPGSIGWGGAIDLLNVDFDRRGRIRSRDGYAELTTVNLVGSPASMMPAYFTTGSKRILAHCPGGVNARVVAIDETGTTMVSSILVSATRSMFARHAAPGLEHVYIAISTTTSSAVKRYEPVSPGPEQIVAPAWTGTTPAGKFLAVQSPDNRLVNARYWGTAAGNNPSTVRFSDAGTPTTWGANNFVDLSPGDGEEITGMASWRDLLFVFKESKFFVFYGNSTDNSGNPVFNYRTFTTAGIADASLPSAGNICVAPHGVYFLNRRGIWLTSGTQPQLISRAIDPIFRGQGASSFYQGGSLAQSQITNTYLHWHDERLYFAFASSSANDRTFIYDPAGDFWLLTDIGADSLCSFRVGNAEELMLGHLQKVYRHSSAYTQDGGDGLTTGAAITSRYRSGFSDLGSTQMKTVREWILDGIGAPTFQTSHDFGSLEAGAAVTLGTSPATAEGRRRFAVRGRQLSWQIGGTTAWTLNNLTANVREPRVPGVHAAA